MTRVCRIVVIAFAVAYVLALALFLIGTFGLFGQERDPLSAVFLLPIGVPWILFLDSIPNGARPWVGAATPALNLLILVLVCRAIRARRT